ncbi:hypothetical protein ACFXHA_43670 [Nocardia sp. NPDC059240]|uniref:hypothetical protein n=1 Tax=Nocardia sp. NPDC059240 TaxID=3346786 RepID=UPI003684230D
MVTLPLRRPPMTSNDQRRMHWTTVRKAKAEAAAEVGWRAREQLRKGLRLNRTRVSVTWYAPDARRRDSDALGPFLKAALDALVAIGVLPDDHSAHVVETSQRIIVDRENPRLTITLEDLDAAPEIELGVAAVPAAAAGDDGGTVGSSISGSETPGVSWSEIAVRADSSPAREVSSRRTEPADGVLSQQGRSGAAVLRDSSCCVVCGEPIAQPGTGRPRKTCSGACRMRASRARTGKK